VMSTALLSRDDDFHITYEITLCHEALQEIAGDLLIELIAHVKITVRLHMEAFGDCLGGVVESILCEAVFAAGIGDLLFNLSFEVVGIIRCSFEANDHNVTTLFMLYEQYTT